MALRRLQVICRFCRLICPFLWIYAAFISKISLVLIWTCDFQIHLKLFLNGILSLVLNGIDLMQITHTYVCEFWEIPNELFFVPFVKWPKMNLNHQFSSWVSWMKLNRFALCNRLTGCWHRSLHVPTFLI